VNSELDELVVVIAAAIMDRDFYVLLNDRLKWICGKDCDENPEDPHNARMVKAFAEKHGWSVRFVDRWYTFTQD
jgi:hypothetical protein